MISWDIVRYTPEAVGGCVILAQDLVRVLVEGREKSVRYAICIPNQNFLDWNMEHVCDLSISGVGSV